MSPSASPLPRWDLAPAFPGFDSPEYKAALADLASRSRALEAMAASPPESGIAPWLKGFLALSDELSRIERSLSSYCHAVYTTDTSSERALAELNKAEELSLPMKRAAVAFRNSLRSREAELSALLSRDPSLADYAYLLREELELQSRQMPPAMEDLAADLSRSGAEAWSRLQQALSSNASCVWDEASGERRTVVELRNLAYSPDRATRERAFRKELECWKSVEIPMAAALNGVKGADIVLDARRGWNGALDRSRFQARLSAGTLAALTEALESALPAFRRYLGAKAGLLGLGKCAFFDLFAPVGPRARSYSWRETEALVIQRFSEFDPGMGSFARRAFAEGWIDAEPRPGKVGGAYCTDLPAIRQSRVLCNFEGSFYSVTTVAHELGHAYHYDCVKDLPLYLTDYPMTLAETASIFAETIMFDGALRGAEGHERLGLLDLSLRDACQVIVDILSRFHFESSVFGSRAKRELGPAELCAFMLEAQRRTYGDALDADALHPYMWAAKGHYYYPDLSFYNYPYAFGQLFGLALFARWKTEGHAFAAAYRGLLRETGRDSCEAVAARAGFDIGKKDFWLSGIRVLEERIGEFERLSGEAP